MSSILAERLNSRVRLTPNEIAYLEALESRVIDLPKGKMIHRAGDPMRQAFVLKQGWVISYTSLSDGSRQIRRVHLPGDLVAMPSFAMRRHAEDVEALTAVTIAPFGRDVFASMFALQPRLAGIMFIYAQAERIAYGDRLASVGRHSCKQKLAFLLADLLHKVRSAFPGTSTSFDLHLTREQMAEITGMTQVHASRMWNALIRERTIAAQGRHVTIIDERRLLALSGYVDRAADFDFGWLLEAPGTASTVAARCGRAATAEANTAPDLRESSARGLGPAAPATNHLSSAS